MLKRFTHRREAGKELARRLSDLKGRNDLLVLALPRGGVPVAAEIASHLDARLDVLVVRKLGMPGHPEFAMGAIASGGARLLHDRMIRRAGINRQQLEAVVEREQAELQRREKAYRDDRPFPEVKDKTLLLVDDGLATGASMRAAIEALRDSGAAKLIVAVPVAPPELHHVFEAITDRYVVALEPPIFNAVGEWYVEFDQTSDGEVRQLLSESVAEH
ncbi:MAG: phosphoribosyltransferase [Gammaproteobacteria bacterium]|nr:phosphoribosyltransferase [Gammaproteobacteria bacterium]